MNASWHCISNCLWLDKSWLTGNHQTGRNSVSRRRRPSLNFAVISLEQVCTIRLLHQICVQIVSLAVRVGLLQDFQWYPVTELNKWLRPKIIDHNLTTPKDFLHVNVHLMLVKYSYFYSFCCLQYLSQNTSYNCSSPSSAHHVFHLRLHSESKLQNPSLTKQAFTAFISSCTQQELFWLYRCYINKLEAQRHGHRQHAQKISSFLT